MYDFSCKFAHFYLSRWLTSGAVLSSPMHNHRRGSICSEDIQNLFPFYENALNDSIHGWKKLQLAKIMVLKNRDTMTIMVTFFGQHYFHVDQKK